MLPALVHEDEKGGWKGKPVVTRVHPTRTKLNILSGPQGTWDILPFPVWNR